MKINITLIDKDKRSNMVSEKFTRVPVIGEYFSLSDTEIYEIFAVCHNIGEPSAYQDTYAEVDIAAKRSYQQTI